MDGSGHTSIVVGVRRGWWAFVDVGRCWLVGARPLSSMGGGGSSLFTVDRSGRSWMVVAAHGGWKVLVVAAGPILLMVVVVVVGRVTGFDVVGLLSS